MKRIVCILLSLGLLKITHAQVVIALLFGDKLNTDELEFGLVVSPVLTNITSMESKSKIGLNLGLYFNVKFSENFFLHPEAIAKTSFGARKMIPYPTGNDSLDRLFANGSVQRNIRALSLPLLLRYRIGGLFFASGGVQVNWMLQAKDVFKTDVNGNELNYTVKLGDEVTMFDLGITGGLEYKLKKDKGMGLGIRYYYGLTDIFDSEDGYQLNTAWLLNISIPIGTGKPE